MSTTTLTVPAEHAEAFYREAIDTLRHAGENIEEGASWFEQGKGDPNRLENEDIPRVRAAISLVERAREGQLEFGAEETVRSSLEGLVIEAGDRVKYCAEGISSADTRRAMAELDMWMTLLDSEPMEEVKRQREAAFAERQRSREEVA